MVGTELADGTTKRLPVPWGALGPENESIHFYIELVRFFWAREIFLHLFLLFSWKWFRRLIDFLMSIPLKEFSLSSRNLRLAKWVWPAVVQIRMFCVKMALRFLEKAASPVCGQPQRLGMWLQGSLGFP